MGARAGAGRPCSSTTGPQNREAIVAACAAQPSACWLAGRSRSRSPQRRPSTRRPGQARRQTDGVGAMDVDGPAGTASRAARAR